MVAQLAESWGALSHSSSVLLIAAQTRGASDVKRLQSVLESGGDTLEEIDLVGELELLDEPTERGGTVLSRLMAKANNAALYEDAFDSKHPGFLNKLVTKLRSKSGAAPVHIYTRIPPVVCGFLK